MRALAGHGGALKRNTSGCSVGLTAVWPPVTRDATVKSWEDRLKKAAETLVKKSVEKRGAGLDEDTEGDRVTDFKMALEAGREEAREARGRT